jgi:galactokinase
MAPSQITDAFRTRFGGEPDLIAIAPGRINLIGEHTDYNDGFVFPAAIDRVTLVAARCVSGQTRLHSLQTQEGEPFDGRSVEPKELVGWARYPAGVAWALRQEGFTPSNFHAVVGSSIPMGSGVSSSAALELAFLVLHREVGKWFADGSTLANLGKLCENKFVGVNSGIMDQMACAMGRQNSAMFLDTRSMELEYAPIPPDLKIVLCETTKARELTTSAYNERRSQCEEAAKVLGVSALRDADMKMLEENRSRMDETVYRRAKHVITENARAQEFKEALDESDKARLGMLMRASHESLRDDYEVSCFELDTMAEAAWNAPGCVGARMTGAGFGGACVALVNLPDVERFTTSLLKEYDAITGLKGVAFVCSAVEGARILA